MEIDAARLVEKVDSGELEDVVEKSKESKSKEGDDDEEVKMRPSTSSLTGLKNIQTASEGKHDLSAGFSKELEDVKDNELNEQNLFPASQQSINLDDSVDPIKIIQNSNPAAVMDTTRSF